MQTDEIRSNYFLGKCRLSSKKCSVIKENENDTKISKGFFKQKCSEEAFRFELNICNH